MALVSFANERVRAAERAEPEIIGQARSGRSDPRRAVALAFAGVVGVIGFLYAASVRVVYLLSACLKSYLPVFVAGGSVDFRLGKFGLIVTFRPANRDYVATTYRIKTAYVCGRWH